MSVYPLGVHGTWGRSPADHQADPTTPGNWQSQLGRDIKTPIGTPVIAVADGIIGKSFGALPSTDPKMAGLRLNLITNDNAYYYAHLSEFAPGLKPGDSVHEGQVLGYSGKAGGVPHLHFAAREGGTDEILKNGWEHVETKSDLKTPDAKQPDADTSKDGNQPSDKDTNSETKEEPKANQQDAGTPKDRDSPTDVGQPYDGEQPFDANPPMGMPVESEPNPPDMGVPTEAMSPDMGIPTEPNPPDMSVPTEPNPPDMGAPAESMSPDMSIPSDGGQPHDAEPNFSLPDGSQIFIPADRGQNVTPADAGGYEASRASDAGGYDGGGSDAGGYDGCGSDADGDDADGDDGDGDDGDGDGAS